VPFSNPDPLRYPGNVPTTGGTRAPNTPDDTATATAWLQAQPWYRQLLASWGNPQTLSLGQRGILTRTAISAGMNPNLSVGTDGSLETESPFSQISRIAAFTMAGYGAGKAAGGFGGGSGATANDAAGGVPIPGGEFDPGTVYGGPGGPSAGIPPEFGTSATDSIYSAAGGGVPSWLTGNAGNITKALTTLAAAFGGKAIANATGANNVPPQLNDLLSQSVQRQKELAPLGTAATAGMYQMLPDFAKTPQSLEGARQLLGVK
jgi:hypothetical protein